MLRASARSSAGSSPSATLPRIFCACRLAWSAVTLQKAGMATATMDQVLRQRDPELLAAVGHAREGEPGAAIEGLGGRVLEAPREALGAEAAKRWLALAPEERDDTLILAPTHAIRRRANEAVREGLAEEGTLNGRALEIDRLVDRRLTRARASEIASYEPGDTVAFHRDVFGCRANDICVVLGHEDGKVVLAHPDGGERRFRPSGNAAHYLGLYDTERIELRAGDRIRWTRNRKPTRPGFGYPGSPELLNGGEAEIVEIGYHRVRFRDGDGEFGLARDDPQLRHLDHAYCTTVHAAQGRTARGAIAVLDAAGAADRELFHVELSRVSHEFLLLTDDREALIELLESRPGIEDGALAALGLDLSDEPAVDPEEFAALAGDWRALRDRAEETETVPFFLPGYRETMARAASFAAIEDLPADMRVFVDGMLVEHRGHLARDREVRGLTERIREHWRRWPEFGWAASAQGCATHELPQYAPWREEGAALLDAGREKLQADGEERRHLEAMPGAGLAAAVEALEHTRRLDDAARFERLWQGVRERAARNGVPEMLAEGYGQVAELGEGLAAAEALDARQRELVAEWRGIHAEQGALAEAVRSLPGRVTAWLERRDAELPPDQRGAADPAHPACRALRDEGAKLETGALAMLRPGNAHAPYLEAMPGAGQAVRGAAKEVREALLEDMTLGFAWLARKVSLEARERGIETFHAPRYGEAIAEARAIDERRGLPARTPELVAGWLDYHASCESLCREIRDWPGQADALMAALPAPDAAVGPLKEWRGRAETLLGEAQAMQAPDGAHAPHLHAMKDERETLVRATRGLDGALLDVEMAETLGLLETTRQFAERTGGIAFDAEDYADLMERVRALDARPGLPDDLHGANRDERWTRDRHRDRFFGNAQNGPAEGGAMPPAHRERSPAPDGRRPDAQVLDEAKALYRKGSSPPISAPLASGRTRSTSARKRSGKGSPRKSGRAPPPRWRACRRRRRASRMRPKSPPGRRWPRARRRRNAGSATRPSGGNAPLLPSTPVRSSCWTTGTRMPTPLGNGRASTPSMRPDTARSSNRRPCARGRSGAARSAPGCSKSTSRLPARRRRRRKSRPGWRPAMSGATS